MRQVLISCWVVVLVVSAACGADKNWNDSWDYWTVAENWVPTGVPNAGHTVWIGYLANSTCWRIAGFATFHLTCNYLRLRPIRIPTSIRR